MFDLHAYLWGLAAIGGLAGFTWLVSVAKRNVTVVDSMWGVFFALATLTFALTAPSTGPRVLLMLTLVALWAGRLSLYLTWRNWGKPEDPRYQAIRRNNSPHFAVKSLYIVFGLQGLLAWIIALPLAAAVTGTAPLNVFDLVGISLWLVGMLFETVADWQLARFKRQPENAGKVMDRGLWRYTRHPNYFGEFCVWWGYYLLAVGAGGWWSIISPAIMTFLLLKVSGVVMLERDIVKRRPAYRDYVERTNAFFPGPSRSQIGFEDRSTAP
ncbi:MAG: DUF1295 domain-containing protein [Gammaproteobacteria bacterium]|nr:DUF1295 domain-containing protein [Gammaproteobacteria bacterium]